MRTIPRNYSNDPDLHHLQAVIRLLGVDVPNALQLLADEGIE
jgi:hypothetical protein